MALLVEKAMVQLGLQESRFGLRIGYVPVPCESRELFFPALPYRLSEVMVSVTGEIQKGRGFPILFAHEEKGKVWRQKNRSRGQLLRFEGEQCARSFSERAIADLIVILRADHQLGSADGAGGTAVPALAVLRIFPG